MPTGGFLTAAEFNDLAGSGGLLRVRHYSNLSALLAGTVNRERTIPRSLSGCNEGTPNLYSVSLTPDIDHSIIDVGFHFQRNCDLDRQARGRLTNFTAWTAAADIGADGRLTSAAAVKGRVVNGNIGDRDTAMFDNTRYTLYEVQYAKGDFGSWRLYLDNWQTGTAAYLPVTTHGGSTAFANPTFATITSPAGKPAIVATVFVPSEGAAPGEAGQLAYYREYLALAHLRQRPPHLSTGRWHARAVPGDAVLRHRDRVGSWRRSVPGNGRSDGALRVWATLAL